MLDETPNAELADSATAEMHAPWEANGFGSEAAPATTARDEKTKARAVAADPPTALAAAASPPPADDDSDFLVRLAASMKEAAGVERARVKADIDHRRETHLAGISARRETESGRIRELADEDRTAIDAWVEREQQRITDERDRRTAALKSDLESSLAEHAARIDGEVERVEAAIADHRKAVKAWFTSLDGETDPVEIARLASRRPAFPDLETVGPEPPASDRRTPIIGVMATARPATKLAQAWAAWNASTEAADQAGANGTEETAAGGETAGESPSEPDVVPAGSWKPPRT